MNQALQQQLGVQQQIQGALGGQASASQQLIDQIQQLEDHVTGAGGAVNRMGAGSQSVMAQMIAAWNTAGGGVAGFVSSLRLALGSLPKIGVTAVATFDLVSDAIEGTLEIARSTASTIEQLFSSAFNVAKSIFSIEGQIVSGLISMSNEFAAAAAEYAQALEDLRKQLGDFSQNPAANVIGAMREMTGELANTGLSVWRVFGNNAKQLEHFTKLATEMGAAWDIFGGEIAASAEVMGAFQKGMGLGSEEMKNFANLAISTGQNLTTVLQEAANYSLQLGPRFGLSAKVISRDVGKMVGDIKNFGNMTVKQMTQSAIYTRKLGLEMDKILGIVTKFDNFEDAAIATSQLSQAFGLNLDAMKLMEEQDPAARVDMIRKAMQQAGKSTENMTRQELALLSAQTGLDEAATRQAFSLDNVGTSYDQITKAGSEAEQAQMTQTEATAKLADAIERLVVTGKQFTSFWDALVQGFTDGIVKFGPMRILMMEIHRALQKVYWAGVSMGQMFATHFPGIMEGIQGLSKYFSAFSEQIGPLAKKFNDFMKELQNMDPSMIKDRTIAFLGGLKETVVNFFATQSAGRNMFLQGMMKAVTTFTAMLPGVFSVMVNGLKAQILQLPTTIKNLLSSVSGPIAKEGGSTLLSTFGTMMRTGFDALKDIGGMFLKFATNPDVHAALKETGTLLMNKLFSFFSGATAGGSASLGNALKSAWSTIASIFSDPAVQANVAAMWKGFIETVGPMFSTMWEKIKPYVETAAATMVPYFITIGGEIGGAILSGLAKGLGSKVSETLTTPFFAALADVKGALGIASPSAVFSEIGNNLVAGLGDGLKGVAETMSAPFKGAADLVSGLLGGSGDETDTTVAAMQQRVASMEELSSRISALKSGFTTDIAAVISEMVKQSNDLDAAMSSIGDVSISAGLEKVGKALGIDNKRFSIENRGLNINVNLNVTMDAKELSTILTQKNLLDDGKSILTG